MPPVPPWTGASEALIVPAGHPWRTPAEASDFDTTPSYAETRTWLERLAAASPLIDLATFGRTAEAREMLLVIASREAAAARGPRRPGGRPRLLVQCGIHPGEIDGKDAGLMLLRDIAFGDRGGLLDKADWLFVPILNVDGHERPSPFNRPNQRGPSNQGWRASAQNLNLNRDYMKVDSPEMTALLALISDIDPDLYVDLHVTDGLDYQYDITFGFQDAPYSYSPAINHWLAESYRPAVNAAMAAAGHIPGPLILALDDRNPDLGLMLPAFPPRFSHGYGDARHLPTVLVENHSLKPVRQRVLGTYKLIEASLALLGDQADRLRAAVATDRAARGAVTTQWQAAAEPKRKILFHPIAREFYRSIASGAREVRWLGTPEPAIEVDLFGSAPLTSAQRPDAYWVPAAEGDAIERLRRHGVALEVLDDWRSVDLDFLRFDAVDMAPTLRERRLSLDGVGGRIERRRAAFAPGSVRVPVDQPLGTLAVLLLEPSSADSLFAMGFFAGMVERTDYMEAYVVAPMADRMLERDPELRLAFEAKLAGDAKFAADPMARLAWFYERTPYADDAYLLYPVGYERS